MKGDHQGVTEAVTAHLEGWGCNNSNLEAEREEPSGAETQASEEGMLAGAGVAEQDAMSLVVWMLVKWNKLLLLKK